METRASHLVVGIFVLVLSIGTAIFGVWLAKRDIDQAFTVYEIVFPGSVFGLQEGSQVVFSGVPVGRVTDIRIDADDPSQVVVEAELEQGTPVTIETTAALVPQGVTGLVVIELRDAGGEAPLRSAENGPPQIAGQRSALEQVFTSTPLLLARGLAILERVAVALSDENIERLSRTLASLDELTTAMAGSGENAARLVTAGADAAEEVRQVIGDLGGLVAAADALTQTLERELGALSPAGASALGEVEAAARAARNLAWRADRVLADSEEPLKHLGDGGVYEFGEMIREIRVLVAALSRIATDFERDPAGFLIGGSGRGFTPP